MTAITPVKVILEPIELEALGRLAMAEMRSSSSQASWIVKQELRRLGLVADSETPQQPFMSAVNNDNSSGQE